MVAVIIHWEQASWVYKYEDARRKIIKLYTHTLKAFGHSRLLIVDVDNTDPLISDAEIDASVHSTLEEAMAQLPGFSLVYVEDTPEAQGIKDFVHPTGDTCYIIGSDYGQLTPGTKDIVVKIPTIIPLWSYVAMGIVLADRKVKE